MSRCSTGATSTSGGRGGPAADEVALVQLDTVRAAAIKAIAPEVSNPLLNSVLIFSPLEDRFAVSSTRIDEPSFAPPLARRVCCGFFDQSLHPHPFPKQNRSRA